MADSSAQPLGLRRAAVAALAGSIRDHGILLKTDQLEHQYAIYNANAGRDRETHQVLSELLDVLEQKTAATEESSTGP